MDSSQLQSKFGFLIVNDREDLRRLLGLFTKAQLEIPDENILKTDGLDMEKIDELLTELYNKGLHPVILLDEYLGTDKTSGTKVFEHVVEKFPEGGLAVGSSNLNPNDQCRLWQSLIAQRETKWEIAPLKDFSFEGIDELKKPMETFLEKREKQEGDSELGNIT